MVLDVWPAATQLDKVFVMESPKFDIDAKSERDSHSNVKKLLSTPNPWNSTQI